MANPLRAAEWRKVHNEDYPSVEAAMEAYADYVLSELEREQRQIAIKAKLLGKKSTHAWTVKFADDVAAFRKRVIGADAADRGKAPVAR